VESLREGVWDDKGMWEVWRKRGVGKEGRGVGKEKGRGISHIQVLPTWELCIQRCPDSSKYIYFCFGNRCMPSCSARYMCQAARMVSYTSKLTFMIQGNCECDNWAVNLVRLLTSPVIISSFLHYQPITCSFSWQLYLTIKLQWQLFLYTLRNLSCL